MADLTIKAPIKPIKVNEDTSFMPVDLRLYVDTIEEDTLEFSAKLADGGVLPEGVILSKEGVLSGKPARGTAQSKPYTIQVAVQGREASLSLNVQLYIYTIKTPDEIATLHAEAWASLMETGTVPESLEEIINRPISRSDIYYLLQRFATFTVWNADDLRLASEGKLVNVAGVSNEFNVYDFEVCLVATPKDLYSHERTLSDALQTARAMVREAHHRLWHVEFGGFDRMANVAWYEVKNLNAKAKHQMEIRNYQPTEIKQALNVVQAASK